MISSLKYKYQVEQLAAPYKAKPQRSRGPSGPCDKADYNKSASTNCQHDVRGVLDLRRVDKFVPERLAERDEPPFNSSRISAYVDQLPCGDNAIEMPNGDCTVCL